MSDRVRPSALLTFLGFICVPAAAASSATNHVHTFNGKSKGKLECCRRHAIDSAGAAGGLDAGAPVHVRA